MSANWDTSRANPGRVLVTGATGFVGRGVVPALGRAGCEVVRGARSAPARSDSGTVWVGYGEIGPDTRWEGLLDGVGTIVHLAGLAHLPDEMAAGAAATFHRVNVEGTARLAEAAVRARVRRFILVSSALVHGPTSPGRPFTEADAPRPATPYARSKLDSELRLVEIARGTGMDWVILRPPLVYGPGARGNFGRLIRLVRAGVPLPLGNATAPRNFVGIDNLADAVARCVTYAAAISETFLVADAESTSSAGLIHLIAAALGRRVWTPRVPVDFLRSAARLAGRERDFKRLFDPLEIESRRMRAVLDWAPPVTLAEGVRRAVAGSQN